MIKKMFSFAVIALLINTQAFAAEKSLSELLPQAKQELVKSLSKVLPVYIKAVKSVLLEIDSLPAGTVQETTRLDQVPVANLFSKHNAALSKVLVDVAFDEGRNEEDVAWLRNSLKDLNTLLALVKKAKAGKNVDAEMDQYTYIARNFITSTRSYETTVLLEPISRFYCNLTVQINRDATSSRPTVTASETCD